MNYSDVLPCALLVLLWSRRFDRNIRILSWTCAFTTNYMTYVILIYVPLAMHTQLSRAMNLHRAQMLIQKFPEVITEYAIPGLRES